MPTRNINATICLKPFYQLVNKAIVSLDMYNTSEKNFFGNSKKCSLEILANGLKIGKNRLEPVATYHGLATPQKLVTGVKWP